MFVCLLFALGLGGFVGLGDRRRRLGLRDRDGGGLEGGLRLGLRGRGGMCRIGR